MDHFLIVWRDDEVFIERELECGADPVVGVVADAVAVAGEDEEEVERALGVAERREEAVVQKLVGDEGEATGDSANPIRSGGGRCGGRRLASANSGYSITVR